MGNKLLKMQGMILLKISFVSIDTSVRKGIILKYATIHNHLHSPATTHISPQSSITTQKATHNHPQPPKITQAKTCQKQLCYCILDVNTETDVDSEMKQWYVYMCVCVCVCIHFIQHYIYYFLVRLMVCFCQHSK